MVAIGILVCISIVMQGFLLYHIKMRKQEIEVVQEKNARNFHELLEKQTELEKNIVKIKQEIHNYEERLDVKLLERNDELKQQLTNQRKSINSKIERECSSILDDIMKEFSNLEMVKKEIMVVKKKMSVIEELFRLQLVNALIDDVDEAMKILGDNNANY